MPTYEYACTACAERLEVVQKFTDPPLTECPACGGALRKVFSAVGVVFKGSGFYKTDSRSSNGKPAEKKSDASAESGSSSETKSDSAKPDSAKSDSGSSAAPAAAGTAPAGSSSSTSPASSGSPAA